MGQHRHVPTDVAETTQTGSNKDVEPMGKGSIEMGQHRHVTNGKGQ